MSTCTAHHCPLYLFLLVCLLSLHACNARHLTPVDHNKSTKKGAAERGSADVNSVSVPEVKTLPSSKPVLEVSEGSEITVESEIDSNGHTSKEESRPKRYYSANKRGSTTSSSSAAAVHQKTRTSLGREGSVIWRVPRNKRGIHKQPGFNLDYSPPKTHPPSHN